MAIASCGEPWVHSRVDEAIRAFVKSLVPAGPELLKGCVTLGFFERRTNKVVFWSYEEKVVWEEWIIPLLVNEVDSPQLAADGRISGGSGAGAGAIRPQP